MTDPTSVFNAAAAALNRRKWPEAAALCDPGSLSLFKRELLARFEAHPEPWTVERLLKVWPDMPREVAEFRVANLADLSDAARILADELPGVTSLDELRAMNPVAVFAAWLESGSHERQIERASRDTHLPPEVLEVALRNPVETTYTVLGTVPENDRIIHIVYRQDDAAPSESDPPRDDRQFAPDLTAEESSFLADSPRSLLQFATLRRQVNGAWRMIADHRFLGRQNAVFAFGYDDETDVKPA